MQAVAEFEKITLSRFTAAVREECPELSGQEAERLYREFRLPFRATAGSAGYDFSLPYALSLLPGETARIPTGVRVRIEPGWWLAILPRSSLGFRYRLALDNTLGVIDSDYYHAENEGHIMIKLTNHGEKPLSLLAGDRFAQGIFLPYGITVSDAADSKRTNGFGSTGR